MPTYPTVLDAGQTAGDVIDVSREMPDLRRRSAVLVRRTDRLRARWFGFDREAFASECALAGLKRTIADAEAKSTAQETDNLLTSMLQHERIDDQTL